MTGLLDDTADYWKSKDVAVRQWLEDANGRYAFRMRVQFHDDGDPHDLFVTARKYMQTPLGAMKKLVAQAQNNDGLLLIRVGDEDGSPAFYVFDPLTILQHGQDNTEDNTRQRRGEKWVDFHPQWGCNLWDFAHGFDQPKAPDDDLDALPEDTDSDTPDVSLTDYDH